MQEGCGPIFAAIGLSAIICVIGAFLTKVEPWERTVEGAIYSTTTDGDYNNPSDGVITIVMDDGEEFWFRCKPPHSIYTIPHGQRVRVRYMCNKWNTRTFTYERLE